MKDESTVCLISYPWRVLVVPEDHSSVVVPEGLEEHTRSLRGTATHILRQKTEATSEKTVVSNCRDSVLPLFLRPKPGAVEV